VVVIDPNNGDVLAFVSQPGFDPNLFVNGIDTETYRSLQKDSKQPLFNRGLRGQYPPGSTIKPFVGLAGLELGMVREHTSTFCPGYFRLPGKDRKYRDWKRQGHGKMNLNHAIEQSCDVYFYDLAQSMGIDRMHDFLGRFGFGSRTGIDIVGELSGLLPSSEWKRRTRDLPWYPGETLITGIGQGFMLTTPLQLASATATLATYGHRLQPRMLFATQGVDEATLEPQPVRTLARLDMRNSRHWHAVIEAMHDVVHGPRGTARRLGKGIKYQMAGKTGTAQVFGLKQEEEYDAEKIKEQLRDHSLFIAFAPVEKPRLAISVIVEHGGSGSAVAAPIAREIFDYYLAPPEPEPEPEAEPAGREQ
jgi:penicillin-binding protein 2